ncbi:MAG TPA: hypothetical protein VFZ24_15090 [Longimicrobiales bacterium]
MDFDREEKGGAGSEPVAGSSAAGSVEGGTTGRTFESQTGGAAEDAGTRAGPFGRTVTGEETQGPAEPIGDRDEGAGKSRSAAESGRNRLAGQLERLGDRLEERGRGMEQSGGVQRRASQVAVRASEALDSGAEYLRSHDPNEMRDDLEQSIRQRPLLSVGLAIGAGFLLARLLRD